MEALGHLTYQPESENLTRGQVLLQMPTDTEHWDSFHQRKMPGAGELVWWQDAVPGLQTTDLTPVSSSLKEVQ